MAIHGDRIHSHVDGDVPIAARRRRRILQKSKDDTPTHAIDHRVEGAAATSKGVNVDGSSKNGIFSI